MMLDTQQNMKAPASQAVTMGNGLQTSPQATQTLQQSGGKMEALTSSLQSSVAKGDGMQASPQTMTMSQSLESVGKTETLQGAVMMENSLQSGVQASPKSQTLESVQMTETMQGAQPQTL